MPAIGVDFRASMNGPIIAFDRGYGKVSFINLLMERNYKVITIANAVGSEHPFVGTTAIDAFKKKARVTHPHVDIEAIDNLLRDNNIPNFVIQDIENILLGPEVKVARHMNDHLFHAVAIRDIYDKKIAQKILRFFLHGFPDLSFF
jgi:predicted nucleotidyltransferase